MWPVWLERSVRLGDEVGRTVMQGLVLEIYPNGVY